MNLSRTERLILANQYQILQQIGPEEEREAYARFREALENGYEMEYDTIAQNVYEKGLTSGECREVIDALQVYDMLQISHEALPAAEKAGIKEYDIRFHGFDGNNETLFMAYAEYFCANDRFTSVAETGEFNSHYPARGQYKAMWAELQKVPSERWGKMTRDEMLRIIAAR
ncbi:MAG: YfbU family protein [Candidatus Limnocylindria bacterium]